MYGCASVGLCVSYCCFVLCRVLCFVVLCCVVVCRAVLCRGVSCAVRVGVCVLLAHVTASPFRTRREPFVRSVAVHVAVKVLWWLRVWVCPHARGLDTHRGPGARQETSLDLDRTPFHLCLSPSPTLARAQVFTGSKKDEVLASLFKHLPSDEVLLDGARRDRFS